jgi:peptidyl-Lys metalloendopeptidase
MGIMAGIRILGALTLAACAAGERRGEESLTYRLTAPETVASGQPVTVGFELENRSPVPLRVLTWNTPLEGMSNDIFRVERDGAEVPYEGPMMKRGNPSPGDYVLVAPGKSVSAEVDLARGYDVSRRGSYRVDFRGRLHDVVPDGGEVPRARDQHRSAEITGQAASFRVVPP